MSGHLFGELVKLSVVYIHLPGSPRRTRGEILESPVRSEDIIEKVETVTSDIHLIDLGISCHSQPDESLIKSRSVAPRHVERLVLEDILLHLVGHLQVSCLWYLLPPLQVAEVTGGAEVEAVVVDEA